MNIRKVSPQQSIEFIQNFIYKRGNSLTCEVNPKKHSFIVYRNFEKVFELRLPLPFPAIKDDEKIENYLKRATASFPPYTIILIQAGYCALGYFEKGEALNHIALRTYMTRRKNGKNQLTHLNSGGNGGTSGGQLRYRNALNFFEEINCRLNQWNKINNSERIFYSCPIKMWQYLFQSKAKCPFSKKDFRLHKIPFDVNVPNFEEMIHINRKISFGYLTFVSESIEEIEIPDRLKFALPVSAQA